MYDLEKLFELLDGELNRLVQESARKEADQINEYDQLIEIAEVNNVSEETLDNSITDVIENFRSAIYNSQVLTDYLSDYGKQADDNLDDPVMNTIDDVFAKQIVTHKDQGLEEQLEFLLYQLGFQEVKLLLETK